MENVVIIGSGCAGLTAAIYAARANLKPVVLEGHEPGGQLSLTTHVENFPGFPDGILGPELIENMKRQAARFGSEFRAGAVTEVDLRERPFRVTVAGETLETKTLIVAAGASARLLGLKGEKELIGRGVSTCATCDGSSKVYLIHRRNEFRASKIMIDRVRLNEKVEFVTPYVVEEISSPQGLVSSVTLRNPESGLAREIEVDGVFVAIGHDPNSTVFKGKLDMDANGYLVAKHGSITNIPGVFIAGDVQDHRYRQAVTAAGSGCMAAIDAEKFLEEHKRA
ncbi:MAG: thioredoxin-disulfide reductase [Acidobacteria bacterium]|nr:MAG: thioredoxin-disulfide reductase [Acidobacteriota bacterium]